MDNSVSGSIFTIMAAPIGNSFWKLRSKHGRGKLFADASLLWEAATEYFEWCDTNPWIKKDFVGGGPMAGTVVDLPTARPYTLQGFCLYCDTSRQWFYQFKENATEDFLDIITRIEETIFTQKFEGAAVGAFNANIIARDLGLVDKKEQNIITEQPLFPDVSTDNGH